MKRTPTFYLKTTLVTLGFIVLIISGFQDFLLRLIFDIGVNGKLSSHNEGISGFQCFTWYSVFLAATIIFSSGYFFHRTVNIVLVFTLAPIFAIVIFFMSILLSFSVGIDVPSSITQFGDGFLTSVIGALLVVTATAISVLQNKKGKEATNDLLDNF